MQVVHACAIDVLEQGVGPVRRPDDGDVADTLLHETVRDGSQGGGIGMDHEHTEGWIRPAGPGPAGETEM